MVKVVALLIAGNWDGRVEADFVFDRVGVNETTSPEWSEAVTGVTLGRAQDQGIGSSRGLPRTRSA